MKNEPVKAAVTETLKPAAENIYGRELELLAHWDEAQGHTRPPCWKLSPKAVYLFITGGKVNGEVIERKFYDNDRKVQIAIASLANDRALLLYGVPGTGKSTLSELLAAAISGNSRLIVQGTAGTGDEKVQYGWNYAQLLKEGPTAAALVKTPIFRAMEDGMLARIEELTRIPSDVQDCLITVLSEKMMPIPEINGEVAAVPGFNVIATANNRDKGVNDLSSALKRRFNTVILDLPKDAETEVAIVKHRVQQMSGNLSLPVPPNVTEEIRRVVRIFRELREGKSVEPAETVQSPSSTLSPAEAISVMTQAIAMSAYFGDGEIQADDLANGLEGAVVKETEDRPIFKTYVDKVVRFRADESDLFESLRKLV